MYKVPCVKTPLPGPLALEFLKLHQENTPKGLSFSVPTMAKAGTGAWMEDVDGNIFLDFVGGLGALAVGYSNQEIVEVVSEQVKKFLHTATASLLYPEYGLLAKKLNSLSPIKDMPKTIFFNSGSEAVENAIKIARYYTKRSEVVAFNGAFHGRTFLAGELTSKVVPYKVASNVKAPGIHRLDFPYCYRCQYNLKPDTCNLKCLARIYEMFDEEVSHKDIAAVIMEPVQGEGGFIVPPDAYVNSLRGICEEHGILLIADEILCGCCKSGRFYASQYWNKPPDIIITGKSIAAGLPLSAVTGPSSIMDLILPGGLGGTYCGNPLAVIAAQKVMDIMERDNYCTKAIDIGNHVINAVNKLRSEFNVIGDVRHRGALIGIEFVQDTETKTPMSVSPIRAECWKRGLLLQNAGKHNNVIRLMMPLITTKEEIDMAFDILKDALGTVLMK